MFTTIKSTPDVIWPGSMGIDASALIPVSIFFSFQ